MTPTLYGRWQTRWFLLLFIGFPVTFLLLKLGWIDSSGGVVFWILIYLSLVGIFWDILYDRLQQFMWDHDWPGLFQLFGNILEYLFFRFIVLPVVSPISLPGLDHEISIKEFSIQYGIVSVSIYLLSWMVMRLLFPRWRFRGGEWLGQWPNNL